MSHPILPAKRPRPLPLLEIDVAKPLSDVVCGKNAVTPLDALCPAPIAPHHGDSASSASASLQPPPKRRALLSLNLPMVGTTWNCSQISASSVQRIVPDFLDTAERQLAGVRRAGDDADVADVTEQTMLAARRVLHNARDADPLRLPRELWVELDKVLERRPILGTYLLASLRAPLAALRELTAAQTDAVNSTLHRFADLLETRIPPLVLRLALAHKPIQDLVADLHDPQRGATAAQQLNDRWGDAREALCYLGADVACLDRARMAELLGQPDPYAEPAVAAILATAVQRTPDIDQGLTLYLSDGVAPQAKRRLRQTVRAWCQNEAATLTRAVAGYRASTQYPTQQFVDDAVSLLRAYAGQLNRQAAAFRPDQKAAVEALATWLVSILHRDTADVAAEFAPLQRNVLQNLVDASMLDCMAALREIVDLLPNVRAVGIAMPFDQAAFDARIKARGVHKLTATLAAAQAAATSVTPVPVPTPIMIPASVVIPAQRRVGLFKVGEAETRGSRHTMEDASFAHAVRDSDWTIFGKLDGHGGAGAAATVARLAPLWFDCVAHKLDSFADLHPSDVRDMVKALIAPYAGNVARARLTEPAMTLADILAAEIPAAQLAKQGCIAVIAMWHPQHGLFVANAGDARALWLQDGQPPQRLTVDHTPKLAREARRITQRGGVVLGGRLSGELGVSRGLGDSQYVAQGLNARPELTHLTAAQLRRPGTLVLGCDGIFDVLQDADIQAIVTAHPGVDLSQLAGIIVAHALGRATRDNASIVLVRMS